MPWDERTKRRLKLRDLDILLAVVETGSMGKAAKGLNISQPAVSKAVVELEDALGVRLLDRSRRGVVPTAYGLALAKHSVTIFNDLRHGIQAIDFLSDPTRGEVRIGTTEPIATAIALPAIDRLSRKYPQISFHVLPGDTASLYKDVSERNIELAICRMIGRLPDELAAEVLFHDAFAIVTSAKNPLTRRRTCRPRPRTLDAASVRQLFRLGDRGGLPGKRTRASASYGGESIHQHTKRPSGDGPLSHRSARIHAETWEAKSGAQGATCGVTEFSNAGWTGHAERPDAYPPRSAVYRDCSRPDKAAGKILAMDRGSGPWDVAVCWSPGVVCAELGRTYIA
jgi:DNA-binding transcriptional LysR family regulator